MRALLQFIKYKWKLFAFVLIISLGLNIFAFVEYPMIHSLKSQAGIFISLLTFRENRPVYENAQNKPIVYYLYMNTVREITPTKNLKINGGGQKELPDQLIIPPGTYKFQENVYRLGDEGLYRFLSPGKYNAQRIVYKSNPDALLSALAWITSHGNYDNSKTFGKIYETALQRKLVLTCSNISTFAHSLLNKHGIKSRVVESLTLEEWNTYNNGHTLLEVYDESKKKWVLYDLDQNCTFEHNGTSLSLVEFIEKVKTEEYTITPLSSDIKSSVLGFKSTSGYSYCFLMEGINSNEQRLRQWYKRVMMVPLIHDGNYFYFTSNDKDKPKIESYSSSYKFLEKQTYLTKFYN